MNSKLLRWANAGLPALIGVLTAGMTSPASAIGCDAPGYSGHYGYAPPHYGYAPPPYYTARYPNGAFVGLAESRIQALKLAEGGHHGPPPCQLGAGYEPVAHSSAT